MTHDVDFHHGYTFSGHPVACAVALKNLQIIEEEGLVPRVKTFGAPALAKMLSKFKDHPLVGEVRSVGLLGAIELVADKRTRRRFADPGRVGLICRDHFFREGLEGLVPSVKTFGAPALIWTQTQFDEADEVVGRALDLTLNDVSRELAA